MAQEWNPIDEVGDALKAGKKKLVKFVSRAKRRAKKPVGKNAPIRGTGDRVPRYYRGK